MYLVTTQLLSLASASCPWLFLLLFDSVTWYVKAAMLPEQDYVQFGALFEVLPSSKNLLCLRQDRLDRTLKDCLFKKNYLFVSIDKFSLRCRPKAATVGAGRALIKPGQKHRRPREHMRGAVTLESSDRLVSHSFPNSK